jgi:hypothetical protein
MPAQDKELKRFELFYCFRRGNSRQGSSTGKKVIPCPHFSFVNFEVVGDGKCAHLVETDIKRFSGRIVMFIKTPVLVNSVI